MTNSSTYIPYSKTGYFSHLVTDYIDGHSQLLPFFKYAPSVEGINAAIEERKQFSVNRKALVNVLVKQYEHLPKHGAVEKNIQLLNDENTFTVCTAHQPNLLTGYLYFVYKIIHAIKLAEELNGLHKDKRFVPIYYMGSEDNDIEELGTFLYNGNKYVWDGDGQGGAVGRMKTDGLIPLLHEFFKLLGPPGEICDTLRELFVAAYLQHNTISEATHFLVNELFGKYGLVVINPDEASLKETFIPVMKDDLLQQTAYSVITEEIEKLGAHYKIQAHPRPINLFYLKDHLRERIEKRGAVWNVVNTDIKWNQKELLHELKQHPEYFSPNVMLRGIYQETILPNVAFIGGGAEVAYWLQLKTVFDHYKIFYPTILLRQSVMWIKPTQAKLREQLQLTIPDIFKPEVELVREYVKKHSASDWHIEEETAAIEKILHHLKQKAIAIETTLRSSSEAVLTKMKYQLQILEKKMLRAEKKKMQIQLAKITRLKNALFPNNGLQERVENFTEYYLQYGTGFFDELKNSMHPLKNEFLIVEDTDSENEIHFQKNIETKENQV